MKKIILISSCVLFLFSCNNQKTITKEECLQKLNNTKNIYSKYEELSKDFIYFKTIKNNKDEITSSTQFAYDSENKLFYKYTQELNTKQWFYFENDSLITLTNTEDEKIKTNNGVQKVIGDNYFKKYFSDVLVEEIENLEDHIIKQTEESKSKYYTTSKNDYGVEIELNESLYKYSFKNNLFSLCNSAEYNADKTIKSKTETKVVYEKFTTSVNKEEYK